VRSRGARSRSQCEHDRLPGIVLLSVPLCAVLVERIAAETIDDGNVASINVNYDCVGRARRMWHPDRSVLTACVSPTDLLAKWQGWFPRCYLIRRTNDDRAAPA